ncbi:hypothetical protein ATCC90586_001576 [Pythium insidiosum]|nr:hypothetical protein ATCC90586_001576 [Pythium insidiosum]
MKRLRDAWTAAVHSDSVSTAAAPSPDMPPPSSRSHASALALERRRPLATSSKHTSSDCVSSTALMVFRGIGAGIAWTLAVDLYTLVSASDRAWREHLALHAPPATTRRREAAKLLLRACGRNVLMFGGFLTVFGGLTCSMEIVRGRHDVLNPFVGGFASGLVIVPRELHKSPRYMLLSATLCGAAAMGLYQFIPASSAPAPPSAAHAPLPPPAPAPASLAEL